MNNRLELMENGKKKIYDILLNVENKDGSKYVLYTAGEKNDIDETIVYAGIITGDEDNITVSPIMDDEVLEYLDGILMQIQSKNKKEVESDYEKD